MRQRIAPLKCCVAQERLVAEDLRPFQTAINQLGAPILTFDRLVTLLEQAMAQQVPGQVQVEASRLESFYRPLWSIVNDLLPETANQTPPTNPAIQRLLAIPFVVTEDLYAVTISQSFVVPAALEAGRFASLLPRLAIAAHHILGFPKIARLMRPLELGAVVNHIGSMCATEPVEYVIGVEQQELRDLYAMFADLDRPDNVEKAVYQALRNLPIWLSSRGLIKATQALLPGNFTDPTGQADLLETSVLTDSAREFVSSKLGVQTQTTEAFVQNVLPRCFNDDGPLLDAQKYTIEDEAKGSYCLIMLFKSLPGTTDSKANFDAAIQSTKGKDAKVFALIGDAFLNSAMPDRAAAITFLQQGIIVDKTQY